jgi:probable HAF family extracellular repeat protein
VTSISTERPAWISAGTDCVAEAECFDLGTLGASYSFPSAVNANGLVVGQSGTPDDASEHAFTWTRRLGMLDLGTLGGTWSVATALNASGEAVGTGVIAGDAEAHATLWRTRVNELTLSFRG